MSYVGEELRRLRRENVRLNRKLALMDVPGKVVEVDHKAKKVRLEIGEDPETGEKIKSPWLKVPSSGGTGATKGFRMPDMGEAMRMRSASGVIGSDSRAQFGEFDQDENKHPDNQAEDEWVFERGDARFSLSGKGIVLTKGDEAVKLSGEGLTVSKGEQGFKIDGQTLAMLGRFTGKGGSRAAHFKGGRDSDNDVAVDGNEDVLI